MNPSAATNADSPGELVHIDVKKLGRIPDGGGHRVLGRAAGRKNRKRDGAGYLYGPPLGSVSPAAK